MALNDILSYIDSVLPPTASEQRCSKCIMFPNRQSPFGPFSETRYNTVALEASESFSNLPMNHDPSLVGTSVYLIASGRRLTGASHTSGAAALAECLAHLGLLDTDLPIVCLDARHIAVKNPVPDGLVIVYDDMGKLGEEPMIPSDAVKPGKRGKLIWTGQVPDGICDEIKRQRDEELRENQLTRIASLTQGMFQLEEIHTTLLHSAYHKSMIDALVALSYGILTPGDLPDPIAASQPGNTAKWLIGNIIFEQLRDPGFEDYANACDMNRISDIIEVWKGLEKKYGFSIRFSFQRDDYSGILELGRLIGADTAMEALTLGVTPEDILA